MNKWKAIAIIFITLFIIETAVFAWLVKTGTDMVNKETECSVNVCAGYDTYYYDAVDSMCYCYKEHILAYQEYLK